MIFRPYLKNSCILKGYAKKTSTATYIPFGEEIIVKILEDDQSAVFIERNSLRHILTDEATCQKGYTRDYLLFIEAGLEESPVIDWFAGFLTNNKRAIYYDLLEDEIAKDVLVRVNEMHFGYIIKEVREMLLERALINNELIVYEKKLRRYADHLEVHGLRSIKGKIQPDSVVKFCLPNKHVILTFKVDADK